MTFRSPKLLILCRELECQICGSSDGTVCAAHSNALSDGKGRGLKASDAAVAALCFRCHSQIDQGKDMSREERRSKWLEAHMRTLRALVERGYLLCGKP
jgi:predicted GNAT superfamily acetyltransferase